MEKIVKIQDSSPEEIFDQVTGLYLSRAFCKAIKCKTQEMIDKGQLDKSFCKLNCTKTAHEFHEWLKDNGFEIKKKDVL